MTMTGRLHPVCSLSAWNLSPHAGGNGGGAVRGVGFAVLLGKNRLTKRIYDRLWFASTCWWRRIRTDATGYTKSALYVPVREVLEMTGGHFPVPTCGIRTMPIRRPYGTHWLQYAGALGGLGFPKSSVICAVSCCCSAARRFPEVGKRFRAKGSRNFKTALKTTKRRSKRRSRRRLRGTPAS